MKNKMPRQLSSCPCSFVNYYTSGATTFSVPPGHIGRCVTSPTRPRAMFSIERNQATQRLSACMSSAPDGQLPPPFDESQTSAESSKGGEGEEKTVLGSVGMDRIGVVFTCTADNCGQRIVKSVRRRSYESGTVVVKCPKCDKIHVVADNLGMYAGITGGNKNIEEIAKAKGQSVTRVNEQSFNLDELMLKLEKDD